MTVQKNIDHVGPGALCGELHEAIEKGGEGRYEAVRVSTFCLFFLLSSLIFSEYKNKKKLERAKEVIQAQRGETADALFSGPSPFSLLPSPFLCFPLSIPKRYLLEGVRISCPFLPTPLTLPPPFASSHSSPLPP